MKDYGISVNAIKAGSIFLVTFSNQTRLAVYWQGDSVRFPYRIGPVSHEHFSEVISYLRSAVSVRGEITSTEELRPAA